MFSNDSILYKYKYINKYKFIFYLFRDLWIGKCAHVLPGSKMNLTKFARFYLLILSHTHTYTHTHADHYRHAVAASRYCNHNYITIISSTSTTTQLPLLLQLLLSLLLSLLLLLLLLRLLLLLLFTIYCMPSVQARTKRFSFIPRLSSRL